MESHNVITSQGRGRLLDVWAYNLNPQASRYRNWYGLEMVDTTPTVVTGGTRRCTLFNVGTTLDPYSESGTRNLNAYDTMINPNSDQSADNIFIPGNTIASKWDDGSSCQYQDCGAWHCVDLARIDTEEIFAVNVSSGNQTIKLIGSNLKYDATTTKLTALSVYNATKTTTYSYGTHYTFDRVAGTITFLQTGALPTANYVVDYKWHDPSIFGAGIVGMRIFGFPQNTDVIMYNTYFGMGRFSGTGGQTWENHHFPFTGRPQSTWFDPNNDWGWNNRNVGHVSSFLDSWSTNNHDHFFFTHPYIMTSPTNFAFLGRFTSGYNSYANYGANYIIQNMNFFKPAPQPQTPRVIALGTGTTAATTGDTALGSEVLRLDVYATTRPANGVGRWKAYIDYEVGTGINFSEVGLFYGDNYVSSTQPGFSSTSTGTSSYWRNFSPISKANCNSLFSRTVYPSSWNKTSDQRVEITYDLTIV